MSSTAQSGIAGKKPPEVSHAALRPNAALSDYLFVALRGLDMVDRDYLQNELQVHLHIFLEYPLQKGAEHAYKFLRGHGRLETFKALLEFIQGKLAPNIDHPRQRRGFFCASGETPTNG